MAPHSILIVDDEPNQRMILEQALKLIADDWQIHAASSASEALAFIEKRPPQLIITDYHMPEMNGLEMVARIRERLQDIQIILMTAYSAPDLASEAERLHIQHYLTKPVPLTILRKLTISALSNQACSA